MACGGRLSRDPACNSLSPKFGCRPLRIDSPSGSGPWFGLAPYTLDKPTGSHRCALPGLAAPGAFQTGLPCGASQPVPPCLGTVARLRPRWRWPSTIRGRDPGGRMTFGASRPVGLSPPAVWRLDHPASNDAKCSPAEAGFQATYDVCATASRSLEERRLLSSPGGFRDDRTWPSRDSGLCVLAGKGGR